MRVRLLPRLGIYCPTADLKTVFSVLVCDAAVCLSSSCVTRIMKQCRLPMVSYSLLQSFSGFTMKELRGDQ